MIDRPIDDCRDAYRWWSQAVTSLALSPWRLVDAQCEAGIRILDALLGVRLGPQPAPAGNYPAPAPLVPVELEKLEDAARQRVRSGKAPPKEVYEVQNRGRIDWAQFPEWARPSDPELYEGCAHEG
jgi:hypothetical protein